MRLRFGHLPGGAGALLAGTVAASLSMPPLRSLIEQSMGWHMAIQMPLLLLSGWLAMGRIGQRSSMAWWSAFNRYGMTGFIAALIVLAYWMLPLAIDRAVVLPTTDVLKLVSLWTTGAVLRHSFERAPAVLQLFFVGTAIPMAIWLGFYFASTDLRLCNAYSLQSQIQAGYAVVALAAAIGCGWLVKQMSGEGFR
jgi:hypothetical protein